MKTFPHVGCGPKHKDPYKFVIASEAWQSRGHGLPRFARNDELAARNDEDGGREAA